MQCTRAAIPCNSAVSQWRLPSSRLKRTPPVSTARWFSTARGSVLLYMLGALAYGPGALLLHPAVGGDREHEAVALYIAGSAAMTLAALVDYSDDAGTQRHQLVRGLDTVHLPAGGGVCFLAGSIATWPGNKPKTNLVGIWVYRTGNLAYLLASLASWRAANSRQPPLGATLYALSGVVFLVGGLLIRF
jgi:hypothetical protein